MANANPLPCSLCNATSTSLAFSSNGRNFHACSNCDLLFVPHSEFLTKDEERNRYDQHQNVDSDLGYRDFLSILRDSLAPKIKPKMRGLDFGSGPSDLMAKLFIELGTTMDRYDPFYGPPLIPTPTSYDFISCSEVAEHLREPLKEFEQMMVLLKAGGWVGVMTQLRDQHREEPSWWYLRDPTHISFYSKRCFQWIGKRLGATVQFPVENVILLGKH